MRERQMNGEEMMKIKAAIFDYDGTLVDSMRMWRTIPSTYARKMGKEPVLEFDERMKYLSLDEAAEEFRSMYGLDFTNEEIIRQVMDMVYGFYRDDHPLKEGAREVLEDLKRCGVPMCVATMTPREMILAANKRLGIAEYFEEIYSCTDFGVGKDIPYIYDLAAGRMGAEPEETLVFEDMVVAVNTAREAGYRVIGICDEISRKDWDRIIAGSDLSLYSLTQWPGLGRVQELLSARCPEGNTKG